MGSRLSRQEACARARDFLAAQAAQGFPEACHRMTFPRAAGFTGAQEDQAGDIFSRAILGALLLDAAEASGGDPGLAALAREQADHVAAQRLADCAGGWSYFPGLPELPPDLDSLAAAITLFARVAPQHLALCEQPIRVALEQRAPDGTIPTFLLSPLDDPVRGCAMQRGVQHYWGNTPDADALACFYRALLWLDRERYAPLAPLEWLAARQEPDGSWLVPWYAGTTYGTRLCASLFQEIDPQHPAAMAAMASLARVAPDAAPMDIAVSEAPKDALVELQQADGSWPPSPWIQMPMGRATGRVTRTLRWQSRTVTTAFCLRALIAR